ncbi:MAG: nickel pincer cofactor biosynthesis protein LarC [Pirellulales bacterium]|nr:nickel pincer cofactor biosynthesis protein LarC [Pirellulales bacterium]
MRTAYLDCASGIAGDMMVAALVDIGIDFAAIEAGVASLGLPGCRLSVREVTKRGFRATQFDVASEPDQTHRHLADIEALIDGSGLTDSQQDLARRIFQRLADAEATVHGTTPDRIHFHEIGAIDSIADIVATSIGWDLLGVEQIVCSPIPTGTGSIEIAHGRVSIPAPATAELLKRGAAPTAESFIEGELTTPTGAAIATTVTSSYGPLPAMQIERIGYGAGHADFEHPNILRLIVGRSTTASTKGRLDNGLSTETICLLVTNIDDASGELVGYCAERLWSAGALDVAITPIQMKKGRPGVALAVQCRPNDADSMEAILFSETTTFGIRRSHVQRRVLARRPHEVPTPWGPVTGTLVTLPNGTTRFSPAYESCRHIAAMNDIPLPTVYATAQKAMHDTT